jgi:hypothetical protein
MVLFMIELPAPPETLPQFGLFPKALKSPSPEDPLHPTPQLWTRAELAEWTRCKSDFLMEEIRSGRLRAIYLSAGRERFRWDDILAWLNSTTEAFSPWIP